MLALEDLSNWWQLPGRAAAGCAVVVAAGRPAVEAVARVRIAASAAGRGQAIPAVPMTFGAFTATSTFWSMTFLAAAMFFLFLSTGPVNTLILESAPVNLRASAMAVSIFTIHLFGDMWSPEIVGRLADSFGGNLQKAVLILPIALIVASALWLILAMKTKREAANNSTLA